MTIAIRQRGRVIPVERRTLSVPSRMKPKPASADILRSIAADLRDMPRECAIDRAELLLWLSRHARQIDAIALDGFEPSVIITALPSSSRVPRLIQSAQEAAEAVFKPDGHNSRPKHRKPAKTSLRSAKGRTVKVETRRAADALQIPLFPDLGDRP